MLPIVHQATELPLLVAWTAGPSICADQTQTEEASSSSEKEQLNGAQ